MSTNQTLYLHTRTTILLLVTLLLAASTGLAQRKSIKQYVHELWTTENGLPQNSALTMTQTRDGYLWFGTQEGLARFDGVEFTVFDRTNTPELDASSIVRILEDREGGLWVRVSGFAPRLVRYYNGKFVTYDTSNGLATTRTNSWEAGQDSSVWIGTMSGLTRYKGGMFTNYTTQDGLPADTVFALTEDSRGRLWVSTPRGLARLEGGRFETITGQPGFTDTVIFRTNDFNNVYEDSRGTFWMVARDKIISYSTDEVRTYTLRDGLLSTAVGYIHEDRTGNLWFGTTAGLVRFAEGRFTTYKVSSDRDENSIFQIEEDVEGNLWLATGKGIARFANGKFEQYKHSDGLSDNAVQRILIDTEGSIWVSTFGGGLDRFRDEKFVTYSSRVGLSYDNVIAVLEDRTGALWVGTTYGGVNVLKNGVLTTYDTRHGMPASDVNALGEDNQGRIWIGTSRGVCTYENGSIVRRFSLQGETADIVGNAFLQRRSGEFLVASFGRIFSYGNGRYTPLATIDTSRNNQQNFVSALFEDSDGTVWISTRSQLYWYKDGRLEPVTGKGGFPAAWAMSYYQDPDGVIWIGVGNHGLYRYKDGTFANISPRHGLFDYTAYVVMEDTSGYLWMSSNRGVYRVSKRELNDVADGKTSWVNSVVYGVADGMETPECNGGVQPSGFRRRDGSLCFATLKGVAIVNPADIRINRIPPPVVVDRFLVEGTRQDITTKAVLPPGSARFELHYAGISFVGGRYVRYKYQLIGLDEDWVDAGSRREAYYTHLDPGEYTFRVKAANSDGIWNEEGASVSFELEPYFYQTGWFIGLVVFVFVTTGPTFYAVRMRGMKRRREELERLVRERTAELQKTVNNLKETQNQLILSEKMASLGQLTAGIAHEIKNPLNFITNFAVLSHDLTADLKKELEAERERVDPTRAREIAGILADLEQNVTKINEHGKRADSIVRGMLLHSRGKAGERQQTDLNALLSEYTNLAYHGMRAQDQSFNVKIETDFDPAVGRVNVVPQDLSRAFLNIVNNACYAANDRRKSAKNGFTPIVRVSAKSLQDGIEIRIRDNGAGIPESIRAKIFNPFFTTKPAGAGTGLGLSLSYDIITQEHKGEIEIDTKEGEYTEFIITIPRNSENGTGGAA